jgi:hypothetical protein
LHQVSDVTSLTGSMSINRRPRSVIIQFSGENRLQSFKIQWDQRGFQQNRFVHVLVFGLEIRTKAVGRPELRHRQLRIEHAKGNSIKSVMMDQDRLHLEKFCGKRERQPTNPKPIMSLFTLAGRLSRRSGSGQRSALCSSVQSAYQSALAHLR